MPLSWKRVKQERGGGQIAHKRLQPRVYKSPTPKVSKTLIDVTHRFHSSNIQVAQYCCGEAQVFNSSGVKGPPVYYGHVTKKNVLDTPSNIPGLIVYIYTIHSLPSCMFSFLNLHTSPDLPSSFSIIQTPLHTIS